MEKFSRCSASRTGASFGKNECQYVQPDMLSFLFWIFAGDTVKLNALLEKSNNV